MCQRIIAGHISIVVSENNSELQDQCYEHNARIIIDKIIIL